MFDMLYATQTCARYSKFSINLMRLRRWCSCLAAVFCIVNFRAPAVKAQTRLPQEQRAKLLEELRRETTLEQTGVSLFPDFSTRTARRGGHFHFTNDRELYRLFHEGSVDSFRFDKDTEKEILEISKNLRDSASKVFLGYTKTGQRKPLTYFQNEIKEFESVLKSRLDHSQQQELARALRRRELLKFGLKKTLSERRFELGLSQDELQDVLKDLAPIANRHAGDVNRFCAEKLAELPWTYFTKDDLGQLEDFPPLPINLLIARIGNQDASQKRNQVGIQKHDLDLTTGTWLFEGPNFKYRDDGRIVLGQFVSPFPRQQTPLSHLYRLAAIDFTAKQTEVVLECLLDVTNRRGFVKPAKSDDLRSALLTFEKAKWEKAAAELLPQQLAPVKTHVRLHACFTLGPKLIHDNLDESKNDSSEFDDTLEKIQKELQVFARKTEQEFCDELIAIVNNRLIGKSQLERQEFCLPHSSCYESLVISLLVPAPPSTRR